jgi:hypothetical protein
VLHAAQRHSLPPAPRPSTQLQALLPGEPRELGNLARLAERRSAVVLAVSEGDATADAAAAAAGAANVVLSYVRLSMSDCARASGLRGARDSLGGRSSLKLPEWESLLRGALAAGLRPSGPELTVYAEALFASVVTRARRAAALPHTSGWLSGAWKALDEGAAAVLLPVLPWTPKPKQVQVGELGGSPDQVGCGSFCCGPWLMGRFDRLLAAVAALLRGPHPRTLQALVEALLEGPATLAGASEGQLASVSTLLQQVALALAALFMRAYSFQLYTACTSSIGGRSALATCIAHSCVALWLCRWSRTPFLRAS